MPAARWAPRCMRSARGPRRGTENLLLRRRTGEMAPLDAASRPLAGVASRQPPAAGRQPIGVPSLVLDPQRIAERRAKLAERSAGILLHISSLPGPHGIGDLGPQSHRFAEFLASAGQSWWQTLPLGPSAVDSPYSALSAFAGNPLFISLELLVEDGLLPREEARPLQGARPDRVSFSEVRRFKFPRLRKAFEGFRRRRGRLSGFHRFLEAETWLEDYALFVAIHRSRRGEAWTAWDPGIRSREPGALRKAREELADEVEFEEFLQFVFRRQWALLRQRC